jgi:preprotein translocase subunit YajC
MKISESTNVSMPMKTVVSLIAIVAIGTMGYFQIIETLNAHGTRLQLMESDLEKNTDFRIKWPRGLMGSLPADSEQFLLIEDLYKQVTKLQETQEMNMTNKVNIEFLQKQVEKLLVDVEKLKDSNREIKYTNGNGH